jgi:hypothetical protein
MEASLFTRASYVVLALCLAATDSQLTIEDPVGRAVPTNGSLHLSCDSPHSAHTAWFRGQPAAGPVPVTGDPRIITNGGDLWFTSFHASEHAGLYYCLVTTDTGEAVRSCPAHLTHASIHHHFSEEPEDTTVGQGATALLRCHLSDSNPPAIYRWKKDGHPISPDNGRVVLSPSGYLYIRNVTETDEGEYQCLAENEVTGKSRRSRVSSLSVNASLSSPPPRLIALPETPVTVPEGERVVFECATDSATATISWSHNSLVSLPHNSNVSLSLSLHQSTKLCVHKVASLVRWLVEQVSLRHHPLPLPPRILLVVSTCHSLGRLNAYFYSITHTVLLIPNKRGKN